MLVLSREAKDWETHCEVLHLLMARREQKRAPVSTLHVLSALPGSGHIHHSILLEFLCALIDLFFLNEMENQARTNVQISLL